MKRGQISLFIITMILLAGIVLYLYSSKNFSNDIISPEVQPIHDYVMECIKQSAEESVFYIGQTGGYSDIPILSSDNIAYYLYDKRNLQPDREKIENEIENQFNLILPFCTSEFEYFKNEQIIEKEILSEVLINNENAIFKVKYPLSIRKDGSSFILEDFETTMPVRLGIMHKVIAEIMNNQMKNTDSICVNCIYEIAESNNIKINILDTNEISDVLFVVYDENSIILEDPYTFYFVNKLDLDSQ